MIIPRIQDFVLFHRRLTFSLFPRAISFHSVHVQLERLFYRSPRIAVLDCG
jgi:hypothetical protein